VLVVAEAGRFSETVQLVMTATEIVTATPLALTSEQLALDMPVTSELTETLTELQATPVSVTVRFNLEARRASSGQPLATFNAPVRLAVDLRGLAGTRPSDTWYLAYQDEVDPNVWHHASTIVHDRAGLLSTQTSHFSNWTSGDDPGAWHFKWEAPSVSEFSGSATYRYPITVPPGRNGLIPNIDIGYSSSALNGLLYRKRA
jgi:hypothetical protein